MAAKLSVPVYCVQAVATAPQDSIEQLARFYAQEIKRIQPEGPYRLIGYSYGACVALELAIQLQQENPKRKDIIESLVLLDGSHRYVRNFRDALRAHYGVGEQKIEDDFATRFESEVLCAITTRIMPIDYDQMRLELLKLPNYQARLDVVVKKVMSSGLPVNADDIKLACDAWCKRFTAADKYDLKKKFKGDVTLIRAEIGTASEEVVGKDFMLHEVTDGKVNVHMVSGNHNTFIQGRNSEKTAAIITNVLEKLSNAAPAS
jgi:fatty acid synthase